MSYRFLSYAALLAGALLLGACGTLDLHHAKFSEGAVAKHERVMEAERASDKTRQSYGVLDDVTSGLDDDGDFRGRTENVFQGKLADLLLHAGGPNADVANQPGPSTKPRLIIRNGGLKLRTANPDEVGERAVAIVKQAGGWVTKQINQHYEFRVPAAQFEKVFAAVEALGVVVHRQTDARDVTEKVMDLELRLRNARALRERYGELLKKATKVEEMLLIERELAKITETIERFEGQLKKALHDVAFSRLSLTLQTGPARKTGRNRSPFAWIGQIGVEHLPRFQTDRVRSSRVRWKLPAGFADMGYVRNSSIRAWAYSPDGIRIVVRRFQHRPRLEQAFWDKEVTRELVRVRGYEALPSASGMLMFRNSADEQELQYGLALIVERSYVTTVEVIGTTEALKEHRTDLRDVLKQVTDDAR
ncbi:MAG: DUF4349 domain-containing protein [Planctomycetota bacterium]|nr:DUF4349 domain-containing protein [Planctomycetota bacterium]